MKIELNACNVAPPLSDVLSSADAPWRKLRESLYCFCTGFWLLSIATLAALPEYYI
jgi:hypothetical protein